MKKQPTIFFTSDLHAFHTNVIRFDSRPFTSVEEMNQALIDNWNSVVAQEDTVYYAGDLSFSGITKTKSFVDQLNGKIHLIMGNHDEYKTMVKLDRFESIERGYREIWIEDSEPLDKHGKRQQICISHYPMLVWNRHHLNSFHLHGHCHHNLANSAAGQELYKRMILDVGCNGHDYTPISYQEVKEIMKSRIVVPIDMEER